MIRFNNILHQRDAKVALQRDEKTTDCCRQRHCRTDLWKEDFLQGSEQGREVAQLAHLDSVSVPRTCLLPLEMPLPERRLHPTLLFASLLELVLALVLIPALQDFDAEAVQD